MNRFYALLSAVITGSPPDRRTSRKGGGGDCSDTQTPSRNAANTSRTRGRASRESTVSDAPQSPRSRLHDTTRSHTHRCHGSRCGAPSTGQANVGTEFVGMHGGSRLDMIRHQRMQGSLFHIGNHVGHDIATAFQHSKDDGFVRSAPSALAAGRFARRHRFRRLQSRLSTGSLHQQRPCPCESHAPRHFVGHSQLPLTLFGRDAVARRGKQVHGIEPLAKWGMRALHQCCHAGVNMMSAALADIVALGFHAMALRAFKACAAIAHHHNPMQAGRIIGKLSLKLIEGGHICSLKWGVVDVS